jgi:hypothetical protein
MATATAAALPATVMTRIPSVHDSDDGIVKMPHLLHATRREFQKLGQVFTEFDPGKVSSQPPA